MAGSSHSPANEKGRSSRWCSGKNQPEQYRRELAARTDHIPKMNPPAFNTPSRSAAGPRPKQSESPSALRPRDWSRSAESSDLTGHASGWTITLASFLIASPMFVFGVQHFIYLSFVANFIPDWIPWRYFWACFTGVALIAAAVGITQRRWVVSAATLLGLMIFLWVLVLHTSRIAASPKDFGEWRGIFQALTMSGCAFALVRCLKTAATEKSMNGLAQWLRILSELGVRAAPWFIGVGIVALGLEHFVFREVTTPQVPVWIPGTTLGNLFSGVALLLCGAGILLQRFRFPAAIVMAVLIGISLVLVHLPVVLRSSRFESDWTKTLVMTGGAMLLAKGCRKPLIT